MGFELLLREPALVGFCQDHGVNILSTPLWELEFVVTDRAVTVPSMDPWEIVFDLSMDDEGIELVLDGELT